MGNPSENNTKRQAISFQKFKERTEKGLANGLYSVVGYGEANSTYVSEKKDHIVTLDMNPAAVARSLKPVEESLFSAFSDDLNSFYSKDNNEYTKDGKIFRLSKPVDESSLKLKLYVETSALGKSQFTYLYKFELSFSDDGDTITWSGGLDKLESQLDVFRNKVLNLCNKRISGKRNLRNAKQLEFKRVLHVVTQYSLPDIQRLAPVLSAEKGRFELSEVDITSTRLRTMEELSLGVRSKNIDGTFNDEVFDFYCEGKSDYDIVRILGGELSTYLQYYQKNFPKSLLYAAGVVNAAVFSFLDYVNLVNDSYGLITGNDLARTSSLSRMLKKKSKKLNVSQNIFGRLLSLADGAFTVAESAYTAYTTPVGFGIAAISGVVQTRKITKGKLSYPQAIIDVASDISVVRRLSPIGLGNPYESDQKQWVNDRGEAISSEHVWYNSNGEVTERPFKKQNVSVDSSHSSDRRHLNKK